jgi:hypothetical protein
MNEFQEERLVVCFEKIADALGGIHEEVRKAGLRYWPEPGKQREAVVSHVPTEEDKIKERQGIQNESLPIEEWLNLGDPEGVVGERSRQWRKDHPPEKSKAPDAGPEDSRTGEPDAEGSEEVKG